MKSATRATNTLIFRIAVLIVHALLNVIVVTSLLDYDLTGSWLVFAGFVLLLLVLAILFIRHLLSFISFIKKYVT